MSLAGQRVIVMGLGRHGGGVAAARFAASQGAIVTVTDAASEASLSQSLQQLDDVPIARCRLGGHDEFDFHEADVVIVNPAVRPDHPLLEVARRVGVRLTSETELFLERCPAKVIGVTGSSGKSTTASMAAAILTAAGVRTWLGGNIGVSLLPHLNEIQPQDWVVLELSSFQLCHLSSQVRMPQVAIVTNCAPNHLDWHPNYEHYRFAKKRLVREQQPLDAVVVNVTDPEVASWARLAPGRVIPLWPDDTLPALRVPGEHNRTNARCAAAAAHVAVGVARSVVADALWQFQGLPHRLNYLGEFDGRRIFNDSKATTPEATIAALDALTGRVWLLAGGANKGADFGPLSAKIAQRACGLALFGTVREQLCTLLAGCHPTLAVRATEHMADAVRWCWTKSQPGDTLLLSPACASLDQFRDYADRGEQFVALVHHLASATLTPKLEA